MKFKVWVTFKEGSDREWYRKKTNSEPRWVEQYDEEELTTLAECERWARDTIDFYNRTLRPNDKPREFISVELIDEQSVKQHQWKKKNLVTIEERGRYFDVLKCERCGVTGKRFGLDSIIRDRRWRAAKYANCEWAMNDGGEEVAR